jgi:hypothetical protein
MLTFNIGGIQLLLYEIFIIGRLVYNYLRGGNEINNKR